MQCCSNTHPSVYAGDMFRYSEDNEYVEFRSEGVNLVSCYRSDWSFAIFNMTAFFLELLFIGVSCALFYAIIGESATGVVTIVVCVLSLGARLPHLYNSMRNYTRHSNQWHRANVVMPVVSILGYTILFVSCLTVVTLKRTGVDLWVLIMSQVVHGTLEAIGLLVLLVLWVFLLLLFTLMSMIHYKNTTAVLGIHAYRILARDPSLLSPAVAAPFYSQVAEESRKRHAHFSHSYTAFSMPTADELASRTDSESIHTLGDEQMNEITLSDE